MKRPDLQLKVKVLTEKEGGRKTPFYNGYRGQFYYDNSDWDAAYSIIKRLDQKFKNWDLEEFQNTTANKLQPCYGDNIWGFKIDCYHFLENEDYQN